MNEPNDQNSPTNEPEREDLPPNSLRVAVPAVVRALRASLGESQQAFATRIGISIRALANYEKDRLPSGKALFKMMDLATESGREDWLALFRRAAYEQFESDTFEVLNKASGARELLLELHKSVMELYKFKVGGNEFAKLRETLSLDLNALGHELDIELEVLHEDEE